MRARTGGLRLTAAVVSLAWWSAEASAQPVDPAIDLQLLEPAIGPRSYVTVADSYTAAPRQLSVDLLVTYLTDPFVIYDFDEATGETTAARTSVVESLFAGQLGAAYGITPRLQIGALVPMVFRMSGEGLSPTDAMGAGGLTATGLGDLVLEAKLGVLRGRRLGVAASGGLSVPTSIGGDYLGDDLPALRGKLAAEGFGGDRLSYAANLGVIGRKGRDVYGSQVGTQLTYGAALAVHVTGRLSVMGEVFGRTGIIDPNPAQSPLEAIGGVRLRATRSVSVQLGGGGGLVNAIGSPALRLFAAMSWSPDLRDSDKDGVPNADDRCPGESEDHDGVEDRDGCPDNDRDGDKRIDGEDRCPTVAEDIDGFDDEDGCPEADNDGDKIGDFDDRCPNQAEDGKAPFAKDGCPANKRDSDDDGKTDDVDACVEETEDDDGFEDWDGCPEDNDKDGIPESADQCPLCPEDKDGKDDGDGCPDFDDDADGVPDGADKCPAEAETANGVADFDGCPDGGGRQSASFDKNHLTFSRPLDFDRRDRLTTPTDVDPIALTMAVHPEVTRWRIVVAARKSGGDDATRARSQRQADAVRARLIERGIDGERLEAIGAVSDKPTVAIVALDTGDPNEPGVRDAMCPAALRPVGREPPTK